MISRKKLIAGNWKMNKSGTDAAELVSELVAQLGPQTEVDVLVCPPFTALETVSRRLEGTSLKLGAQNMHAERSGAYTGEISAPMLRDLFVTYVILGHSERRALFGETDAIINAKVLASLKNELRPILCVGETLAERDAGQTLHIVQTQLEGGLAEVAAAQAATLTIAYEPVWAIGTGKVATAEQAQEVHHFIREQLARRFEPALARKIRILYGGSMKPDNAPELLAQKDIDGGLIGGASLEARSFLELVTAAAKAA